MNDFPYKGRVLPDGYSDGDCRNKYKTIFENAPVGTASCKVMYNKKQEPYNYFFVDINRKMEELFSIKREKVTNQTATDVFEYDEAPYLNIFAKTAETGVSIEFETYSSKLNKYLVILAVAEGNGCFLVFCEDITRVTKLNEELKFANNKAEESNRLKASLLSNLSHEFRTPMTGILGMSVILKEKNLDADNVTIINYIQTSGRRLMQTLNAILEFANDESEIKNIKLIPLSTTFEPVVSEYKKKAGNKGLNFRYTVSDNNLAVNSTEKIIKQILCNLLDNAIKFTEAGNIEVTVSKETNMTELFAKITVEDSGIGISPKDQEMIFQEFRQVSEGIARSYEGVGLGLTLVKKMTEMMKGRITVRSQAGKGSVFTVFLPAELINTVLPFGEQEIKINMKNTNHLPDEENSQILLVEDNLINIKVTQAFLQDHYLLDYARTGQRAIEMAENKKYAIILMDINLGIGMDGINTAKAIRKIPGYENTPVIALTGYAMESEKEKLLSEGFAFHLAKPFDKSALLEVIGNILEKAEQ